MRRRVSGEGRETGSGTVILSLSGARVQLAGWRIPLSAQKRVVGRERGQSKGVRYPFKLTSAAKKWYLERVKKLILPTSAVRIFNKLHG